MERDNYTRGRMCACCGRPICDYAKGPRCRRCLDSGHNVNQGTYETRVDMAISPWCTIDHGVLMRTVEARA